MEKRCALVIGHGDDAELLDRNLRHHRAMGAGPIVVSTLVPDPEVAAIVRAYGDDVIHRIAGLDGEDPANYFEHAARELDRRHAPAWIGFIDTDEFIVTRSGTFDDAAPAYDLRALRRYNAVAMKRSDGAIVGPDLDDLRSTPLATGTVAIEDTWRAGDTGVAYVDGLDLGSKIFARPHVISGILPGAHRIRSGAVYVPRCVDRNALIVHLPFTTFARFRRKVEAIRVLLTSYGDRFDPWHWKHWASMSESDLRAEFARQVVDLQRTGHVSTADDMLAALPALPDESDWFFSCRVLEYDPGAPKPKVAPAGDERVGIIFDYLTYASRYSDLVRAAREDGIDLEEHFFAEGLVEGRRPSYAFDPHAIAHVLERRFGSDLGPRDLWWKFFDLRSAERPIPNTWFDPVWFQATYGAQPDAWTAFATYLEHVAERAYSPNGWFDEAAYRRAHPALAAAIEAGTYASGVQHAYATLDGTDPLA